MIYIDDDHDGNHDDEGDNNNDNSYNYNNYSSVSPVYWLNVA